jgi:chaperonin GroES
MRGSQGYQLSALSNRPAVTQFEPSLQQLHRCELNHFPARRNSMPATATKSKSKSKVTLQPLGDKVVVERDETEEKTAGGIYIPDTAKDKPTRGTIIAVGTGKLLDDGSRGEMQVKKGDRVLFTSYAPETINIGDDEYLLMSESDILAVIE